MKAKMSSLVSTELRDNSHRLCEKERKNQQERKNNSCELSLISVETRELIPRPISLRLIHFFSENLWGIFLLNLDLLKILK